MTEKEEYIQRDQAIYDTLIRQVDVAYAEVDKLRSYIVSIYGNDRPRKVGLNTYEYTILDRRNQDGTYTVPERDFLPKDSWGMRIRSKTLQWHVPGEPVIAKGE